MSLHTQEAILQHYKY